MASTFNSRQTKNKALPRLGTPNNESLSNVLDKIDQEISLSTVRKLAGEILTANKYVFLNSDGKLYNVDNTLNNKIEGIGFVQASTAIDDTAIVISSGVMSGFTSLIPGSLYFASTNGNITDIIPTIGWSIPVGIALSATELLINPLASSNAIYIGGGIGPVEILNEQTSWIDIPTIVVDPLLYKGGSILCLINRKTDTQELASVVTLSFVTKSDNSTIITTTYSGDDTGVSFGFKNDGTLQYQSTNVLGANYSGELNILKVNI